MILLRRRRTLDAACLFLLPRYLNSAHLTSSKSSQIVARRSISEKKKKKESTYNAEKIAQTLEKLGLRDEGNATFQVLPGAQVGKVVLRFPPEASGFLHFGHSKALFLNWFYKQMWRGKLILRFDDTDPDKGDPIFEQAIKEDIEALQVSPDQLSHSSDHFPLLLDLCEMLISRRLAFVDDTNRESMQTERHEGTPSKNRNNSAEQNLEMWEEMKQGTSKGQECCVRLKVDMSKLNAVLRDPVIYRCKAEAHSRTGNQYNVYPTYDFACPIIDSTEGVTHALRTTEYRDRDELYTFVCSLLGMRKPFLIEFARLNMQNMMMSKRRITEMVDAKVVEGWDDPRLPTIRGLMRQGLTAESIKRSIIAQGTSQTMSASNWSKIWADNRRLIEWVAPRFTALECREGEATDVVPVIIRQHFASRLHSIPLHPQNADVGTKEVWFSQRLLIEQADAAKMREGDAVTFMRWGNLRVVEIKKMGDVVVEILVDLDLENTENKNTLKVTWLADTPEAEKVHFVSRTYWHIIGKHILRKEDDWKDFVNKDSMRETSWIGEPALRSVKEGDIIELTRKHFYRCDRAAGDKTPMILIEVPDGRGG